MPGLFNNREAGRVIISDPGSDKPIAEYGMIQCCHCGGQFPAPRFGTSEEDKRSRVGRGFCQNCNGYICGAGCLECVPTEQYLENIEAGRPDNFKPIVASVPRSIITE